MQVEIHAQDDVGHDGKATFLCAYFQVGELPVVLAEDEIVAPAQRWELRASGLWADMICEQPFKHWSYGLEAFGLAIDEPDELLGRGYGDRVPLGWELDFESDADRVAGFEQPPGADVPDGYRQAGLADGLVLLADRSVPIHGPAVRYHWWGSSGPVSLDGLDGHLESEPGRERAPSAAAERSEVAIPMSGRVWRLAHRPGRLDSSGEPAAT